MSAFLLSLLGSVSHADGDSGVSFVVTHQFADTTLSDLLDVNQGAFEAFLLESGMLTEDQQADVENVLELAGAGLGEAAFLSAVDELSVPSESTWLLLQGLTQYTDSLQVYEMEEYISHEDIAQIMSGLAQVDYFFSLIFMDIAGFSDLGSLQIGTVVEYDVQAGHENSGSVVIFYEVGNTYGHESINDNDIDNDGIANSLDNDMDGDGIPNGSDDDKDGDGVPNGEDKHPENPHKSITAETEGRIPYLFGEGTDPEIMVEIDAIMNSMEFQLAHEELHTQLLGGAITQATYVDRIMSLLLQFLLR